MTVIYALTIALAVIIILLGTLVIGLLRSHAEILRKLEMLGVGEHRTTDHSHAIELTAKPSSSPTGPHDIAGITPDGEPVVVSPTAGGDPTLLAFLSTSCSSCTPFWERLDSDLRYFGGHRYRVLIITRGESEESPSRAESLAASHASVVMSSSAWDDYEVPGAPFFAVIDPDAGVIVGEGSSGTFEALEQFLIDAGNDADWDRRQGRATDAQQEDRVDADLRNAGILPGDHRLYHDKGDLPEAER